MQRSLHAGGDLTPERRRVAIENMRRAQATNSSASSSEEEEEDGGQAGSGE